VAASRLGGQSRILTSFAALCWPGNLKMDVMSGYVEKLTVKALFEGDKFVVIQGLDI
jgi:hypothetical protein